MAKTTFKPGDTVRVTLKGVNRKTSALSGDFVLNIRNPYDSEVFNDDWAPVNMPAASFTYVSFDYVLPASAVLGNYDLISSLRSASNWNTIYDTTAPGANNTNFAWIIRAFTAASP
jgi:hypothetical protein